MKVVLTHDARSVLVGQHRGLGIVLLVELQRWLLFDDHAATLVLKGLVLSIGSVQGRFLAE